MISEFSKVTLHEQCIPTGQQWYERHDRQYIGPQFDPLTPGGFYGIDQLQ